MKAISLEPFVKARFESHPGIPFSYFFLCLLGTGVALNKSFQSQVAASNRIIESSMHKTTN